MTDKMKIHEAAVLLGMTDQQLRVFIQNGCFDFATGIRNGGGRWTYYINRGKLLNYLNKEV